MSRFFSQKHSKLVPYTPGEQPKDMKYIKLNTNESPYPPSRKAIEEASVQAELLRLYPDPECSLLIKDIADYYGVESKNVVPSNGSDEILNFAFMAYGDNEHPFVFPDITYGFYNVFCTVNNIPYEEIPLAEDLSVRAEDYIGIHKPIILANPNAPTGIALPLSDIERIVASNPDTVVLIDEAYVDFGGESAIPLIKKYDNLIVTQTFSKSRSMAGARLGFGVANRELIRDMNTVKYSTNPYNVNAITQAMGIGSLRSEDYTRKNCQTVIENREYTKEELRRMGFTVTDSKTNFLFAAHPTVSGEEIYCGLRERGILVRLFTKPEIANYNRITVGTRQQMEALLYALRELI